jgi:hypothetical protein
MDTDFKDTIIDSTKPNAGRIYDYLIGGGHYFEVDKQMGDKLLKMMPFGSKLLKFIRWFLHEAIRKANDWSFNQFIDFASGLPVQDHIHNNTPRGTKVVYSDKDPVTTAYGLKIIGENPLVKYLKCDAGTPEIVLESYTVKNLFGDNHKAAIGFTGICWFLTDEQIAHATKVLYEWADPGSIMYISYWDNANPTKETEIANKLYTEMNSPFYFRNKERFFDLIKP